MYDWNHVVLTYDGSKATSYLNGVQTDVGILSGALGNTHCPLMFGYSARTGNHFIGLMDDVSILLDIYYNYVIYIYN